MPFINPPDEIEEILLLQASELAWIVFSTILSVIVTCIIMGMLVLAAKGTNIVLTYIGLVCGTALTLKFINLKYHIFRMLIRHWFGRTKSPVE